MTNEFFPAGEANDVHFCGFTMNRVRRSLHYRGAAVPLRSKEFDLLAQLVERYGSAVSKDEILSRVWGEKDVSDYTLAQTVHRLRQSLIGRNPSERYIKTLSGFGYQFVAPLSNPSVDRTSSQFLEGPFDDLAYAMDLLHRGSPSSVVRATGVLGSILRSNRRYVAAMLALSQAYIAGADFLVFDHGLAYRRARRLAESALRLLPHNPESFVSLGHIALFQDHDVDAADRINRAALELNPYSVRARSLAVWLDIVRGECGRALDHVAAIASIDASSPSIAKLLALSRYFAGRFGDAHAHFDEVLLRNPNDHAARLFDVRALIAIGEIEAALRRLLDLSPADRTPQARALHAFVAARIGDKALCSSIMQEELRQGNRSLAFFATMLIGCGRFQEAAETIHRAVIAAEPRLILFVRDPLLREFWISDPGMACRREIEREGLSQLVIAS